MESLSFLSKRCSRLLSYSNSFGYTDTQCDCHSRISRYRNRGRCVTVQKLLEFDRDHIEEN